MTDEEIAYGKWVASLTQKALAKGVTQFADLVELLPGVYPTTVLEALLEQPSGAAPGHHAQEIGRVIESARRPLLHDGLAGLEPFFPPHPLDFEWRFSRATIDWLLSETLRLTPKAGEIGLLATPSVATHPLPHSSTPTFWYYGRDADTIRSHPTSRQLAGLTQVDLAKLCLMPESVDTVLVDPPWYDEYMRRFIWHCAKLCRLNGHALLAFPGAGTRVGMQQEFDSYRQWWEDSGFVEVAQIPGAVAYESPLFERNALKAAGVPGVRNDWRRASLLILRKARRVNVPWPGDLVESGWQEVAFGSVRVRVDTSRPRLSDSTTMRSIVPGDVLGSVSRRHAAREHARIWTSGNRIFACDDAQGFLHIARRMQSVRDPANVATELGRERSSIALSMDQLSELVALEQRELAY